MLWAREQSCPVLKATCDGAASTIRHCFTTAAFEISPKTSTVTIPGVWFYEFGQPHNPTLFTKTCLTAMPLCDHWGNGLPFRHERLENTHVVLLCATIYGCGIEPFISVKWG